jgi:hypothetical protein
MEPVPPEVKPGVEVPLVPPVDVILPLLLSASRLDWQLASLKTKRRRPIKKNQLLGLDNSFI